MTEPLVIRHARLRPGVTLTDFLAAMSELVPQGTWTLVERQGESRVIGRHPGSPTCVIIFPEEGWTPAQVGTPSTSGPSPRKPILPPLTRPGP